MLISETCLKILSQPISDVKLDISKQFIHPSKDYPTYAMGRNEHALALHKAIGLSGIIDDYFSGDDWEGCPIIPLSQLAENAFVVNCVFSSHSVAAELALQHNAPNRHITYFDLKRAAPDQIPTLNFSAKMQCEIVEHAQKWDGLVDVLDDDSSREILVDLIHFRLTGEASHMKRFVYSPQNQYFDKISPVPEKAIIVDAGGFDGDTTELFCKNNPDYAHIFLFEPSSTNIDKARKRLADKPNIHFIEKGVCDEIGQCLFNDDQGTANAISADGNTLIQLTTIDHELNTHAASFIKMDIEGFELQALHGAKKQITNHHPALAISVYHNAEDFWRIPEYVLSLRDDYTIHLRHYTQGWSETVMYFKPKT